MANKKHYEWNNFKNLKVNNDALLSKKLILRNKKPQLYQELCSIFVNNVKNIKKCEQ